MEEAGGSNPPQPIFSADHVRETAVRAAGTEPGADDAVRSRRARSPSLRHLYTRGDVWINHHMSQATLGSGPYRNSNLFSGYYLDERVSDLDEWDCDAEASEAFDAIRELWLRESSLLETYNEDALVDAWIGEILDVLGFGTASEATLPNGGGYVDRLLYEDDDARRAAAERKADGDVDGMFSQASTILEAKQWDADFERRFSEQRSYRDASHQIKYYLERTPSDLRWGVLTDGKRWRLYGTKDYETQTYYEVDLPEILETGDLEAFKYFYVFFRSRAFVETAGSSFLDDVWTESETAAQELGEDLQDNVFRALRVLGKGFVESNDLDIDPDDEDARDELKEQSLVLLYRLMFVLYAESRGLIDPDDPDASEEYREYFSLEAKREEILDDVDGMDVESGAAFSEEYSRFSSSIWGRLTELFELIDEGEEALDVPPYNGGLFDRESHAFLDDHEVTDPYIAEVIFWLSTTENDAGEHVPADYADLDTRHLGSIYEGLLEHEFRIAGAEGVAAVSADGGQVWKPAAEVSVADAVEVVEEGGLYVVNDEGERKATGAYYTPDYVVTYIVEETVDPLIDEIDADLREQGLEPSDREYFVEFWQAIKELTVLDPAMGSGHFLTKATGYLTEQVMSVVREQEIQSYDEQYIRREISKECIYGVDLNGMAVELAKLSMWLETLAADQPLAFLDHHLKAGNSLVGSDITEVLSEDNGDDGGQLTLTQAFARVRQDTLEHVMELMADLLAYDNETLADVKSMEVLYDEIRDDPLYKRLFELANVHTAEAFGVDVPEGAYEQMAGAIEDADDWAEIQGEDWFKGAQATADEQAFFHWELEYPEVFFDSEGEKMDAAGFDAVVGNPPWIATAGRAEISANMDVSIREYLSQKYTATNQQFDIYVAFYEKFVRLSSASRTGIIIPDAVLTREQNSHIRKYLLENTELKYILHAGMAFEGVENGAVVLITGDSEDSIRCGSISDRSPLDDFDLNSIPHETFKKQDEYRFLLYLDEQTRSVLEKMESFPRLGETVSISRGEEISKRADFLNSSPSDDKSEEIIPGSAIREYGFNTEESRYIDPNEIKKDTQNYESPKLVFRQTASTPMGALDTNSRVTIKSVYNLHIGNDLGELRGVLGVLNSKLLTFYHDRKFAAYRSVFPQINQSTFKSYPIADPSSSELTDRVERREDLTTRRSSLDPDLLLFFGRVECSEKLDSVGTYQPTAQADSALHSTKDDLTNLKLERVKTTRESRNDVVVTATARYKPDDGSHADTDSHGYTETEYLPAFRITDLSEREADLIEHFVPVAVDEAGGFANFRETATKTNSLIDRLKAIELPDVDDVADDLENYLETKERAEELDEKIEQTDRLIDEIVYELYGLTDEEIEIVEEAVN